MVDRQRVVEVYARLADGGGWSCGSGYAVGGALVLTSGHVVGVAPAEILVRRLPEDRWVPCEVVWRGSADGALLRGQLPGPASPVPWGRLTTGRAGTRCEAVGFPEVLAAPDRARHEEHLSGRINPLTRASAGLHDVAVDSAPAQVSRDRSPWAGMSGAAVFCGELLVGVVGWDTAGFGSRRVTVCPVTALAADPAFRTAVERATGRAWEVGSAELHGLFTRPARITGPASLLRADAETVPFTGRAALLDQLREWCLDGAGFGVRLLVGVGGQGKTRVAQELAARMRRAGWVAGLVADAPPEPAVLAALAGSTGPVLLVVDCAETRAEQLRALVEALPGVNGPAVRVLLVARAAGEWRLSLAADCPDLADLATAPVDDLPPLAETAEETAGLWRSAVDHLAARLPDVAGYPGTDWPRLSAQVPPPPPTGSATVLGYHMDALVRLLQAADPLPGTTIEDVLLLHERRYWTRAAAAHGIVYGPQTLAHAVAAATTWSARDLDEALTTLRALPELADQPAERLTETARWLHDLYPPDGGYWGPLRPDRLAEHLAATTTDTDWLSPTAAAASATQAHHALTVLARAALHHPGLGATIGDLITRYPARLAPAAVAVATETEDPAPLTAAVDAATAGPDLELLNLVMGAIPTHTLLHRERAADLATRIVAAHRPPAAADPDAHLPDLAWSLIVLSARLAALGRHDEGLAAGREAVRTYRQVCETHPDDEADLATSLNNLSVLLGDLGHHEESLAAAEEAVTTYRRLARANPDAYLPDVAMGLGNLASQLGMLGRLEESLSAGQEVLAIYRKLADQLPGLAGSLSNLSIHLYALGRHEEGLAASQQAVAVFRQLAATRPDAHLPDLATSLNNHSNRLGTLRRHDEGLVAGEEAVAIRRQLAAAHPGAHLPGLALSLSNLSLRLGSLRRHVESLAAAEEAVAIQRQLAAAHLPDLATSLNNLSLPLGALGRHEEGLAANQEAVTIQRRLADTRPGTHIPALAISLSNLSLGLGTLDRHEEGLAVAEEAVAIHRSLVEAHPGAYLDELSTSLKSLSYRLRDLGRSEESIAATYEAVALRLGWPIPAPTDPDW
jgi:tetratricopeptide (TPR) repeat protein